MSKIILALFVILVSVNAWSVNLDKKVVSEAGVPITEELYVKKVNFGTNYDSQEIPTIFDISNDSTWVLEKNTCKNCFDSQPGPFECKDSDKDCVLEDKFGGVSYAFGGQVQFTSPQGPSKNTYKIGKDTFEFSEKKFKDVQVNFPVSVAGSASDVPKQDLFGAAQAGIGLGSSVDVSFTTAFNNKKYGGVKTNENSFSFYKGKVSQFIFGKPQEFFSKGSWKTFQNYHIKNVEQLRASYSLQIQSFNVGETKIGVTTKAESTVTGSQVNKNVKQYGIFSSTSKYISFEDVRTLNTIVSEINKVSGSTTNCVEQGSGKFYYLCNRDGKFPTLSITLSDSYGESSEFELKSEDYTEEIEVDGAKKTLLLLRRGLYGQQSYQYTNISGGQYFVWLGYPFFNRHYVNFNYKHDQIQITDKFEFTPQSEHIKYNPRIAYLILGILGLIFGVVTILLTLKQVPFNSSQRVIPQTNRSSYPNYPPGSPVRYTGSPKKFVYGEGSPSQTVPPYQYLSNFVHIPQNQVPPQNMVVSTHN